MSDAFLVENGSAGIDTLLRRAAIAGYVGKNGDDLGDYFIDLLDDDQGMIGNIPLDRNSLHAIMRWISIK